MTKHLRPALLLACFAVTASTFAQTSFQPNLMPLPSEITQGSGALVLKSTFKVETPRTHDARLEAAIARAVRRMETAADLRHEGRGVFGTTPLVVSVAAPGQAVQSLTEDESYSLTVTSEKAMIEANTDVGAMHGLETLIQLVQPTPQGYEIPAVTVHDSPRFPWRGLMIDCGRHFEPIPVIERNIDAMAAVKLNVFHWHLTEDQGFRIESKLFPKLTTKGSDGFFYTQDEVKEVVAYARARGIRVVPEFEMPGHSAAWLYAYPELASGTVPDEIRREFGISNTALDPTREETYVFVRKLLTELTALFPDAYVHIGGDETPAPDWKTNPRILAFKKAHNLKDNDALQAYFNTRVLAILTSLHKRMMGWDEILTPELPKDIVVQSWRGAASLAKGARMGYEGILSAPYYLDGMRPAGVHYLADPVPADSTLTAEEKKRILGGETPMWAEHLNERDIDSRIWPRAAAIAERFWSPQSVTDVDDMYRRLAVVSLELESVGLTHLQSGDARLRAMAHTEQIDDLRTVASAMEPVSFGERSKTQHTDQLTALDRFVDAVRPDPASRHWSELTTTACLKKDAVACAQLTAWFQQIDRAIPHAKEQAAASPQMQDVLPRLDQMHALMVIGEQAADAVEKGSTASGKADWQATLNEAKRPAALVRFTFLDALTKLVEAAK
ncbi:beta-N-acetylhexosaminidase [Terriglobus tenax]|uniref:beta-N-acetylhexosaminidase n=1 Tax=Terriglobus tenax TaxID=1111115 RepID=UPI0021E03AB8|nr:beta-N-acetylhexosaminidase [Terriglobus tenax]